MSAREVTFARTDSTLSTLPEHLRYRPYTVPNPCPNVESRYLSPRKQSPRPAAPTFTPQTDFGPSPTKWRTQPRYLQPRARTPEPRRPQQYHESSEYETHKRVARAAGFANVESRLIDPVKYQGKDGELSPRDEVDKRREANRRISGWRSNPINGPSLTFEEIRQRNQHLRIAFEEALRTKKNKTPSVVGDYCREGTPIRHHTMSEAYITPRKRDFAPRWSVPGGSGGGRWSRDGGKGPINRSTARTDERVKAYRTQSRERVVSHSHVPRVATLAASYSLQRWESEANASLDPSAADDPSGTSPAPFDPAATLSGAAGSSPSSAGPTAAGPNGNGRQGPEDVEVIEGPVTVSVPRGAVVRIGSSTPASPPARRP